MNLDECEEKQAVMKQKEMMKAGIIDINGITVENDGVDAAKSKLSRGLRVDFDCVIKVLW
jgi:hypothetical protein